MAKIVFEKLRWKNLLSTGNVFSELDIREHNTTVIIGKNGAGKSTVLDAVCFALFGRTFRQVNKPQIVNSINKKDCLVELEFSIGKKNYLIRRGAKPNLFEIFCGGELMNQPADTRDYQKILEQQIIKMNFRVFTQIVILGSSSYVPFMKLSSPARREVIDEILGVRIFTIMNELNKAYSKTSKEVLSGLESNIAILRERANTQKRVIKLLQEKADTGMAVIDSKITALINDITQENKNLGLLVETKKEEVSSDEPNSELQKVKKEVHSIEYSITSIQKDMKFYVDNDSCPTCAQLLKDKESIVSENDKKIAILEKQLQDEKEKEDAAYLIYQEALGKIREADRHNQDITRHTDKIATLNTQLEGLNSEKIDVAKSSDEIDREKAAFSEIVDEGKKLSGEKNDASEVKDIRDIASLLLKDSGIKTVVVKEYLPIFNKYINKFLTEMNFYIRFELDDQFNENIKSRNRDTFSYMCFSEGERMRIDLAIMFTFREIAKVKSSLDTNLLFLDEILDGTLDDEGVDFLLNFISNQKESNIYLITHKGEAVYDKFEAIMEFKKKGDFSIFEMKENYG